MENQENDKKRIFLPIILVLLLVVSIFGITYAIFSYGKEGRVSNTVTTGTITFSYTEMTNGISLENALPITDEVGKKLESGNKNNGYFDFNVSCTMAGYNNIFYEVYATKLAVENELDEKYVKIYLTDGSTDQAISGYDGKVPTYNNLKQSVRNDKAKQLYYGSFTSSGTQKFRLRMWISDDYMLASSSEHFKIKVNVEAND